MRAIGYARMKSRKMNKWKVLKTFMYAIVLGIWRTHSRLEPPGQLFPPVGTRGLKSRMCPPYPHACRKRRLKWGAVIAQVADTTLSINLIKSTAIFSVLIKKKIII